MARQSRYAVDPNDLRSVYNTTGSAIAKGTILTLAATPVEPEEVDLAVVATKNFLGVAFNDIPIGARGTAQIRGKALVLVGTAGVTAATRVKADASGLAIDAADADQALGTSSEAGTSGDLIEVELAGPGAAPPVA